VSLLTLPAVAAAKSFVGAWWKAALGALVVFPFAFLLGQCSGAERQREHEKADRAIALAEAVKQGAAASNTSAERSVVDAAEVADLKKELTDAVADLPDSVPDAHGVALGCARLRNAGEDVSKLPACGGREAGGQAQAEP